jgi:hypothetical protein
MPPPSNAMMKSTSGISNATALLSGRCQWSSA